MPTCTEASCQEEDAAKKKEEEERDRLKADWLNLLFTDQSVAAMSPEACLFSTTTAGLQSSSSSRSMPKLLCARVLCQQCMRAGSSETLK